MFLYFCLLQKDVDLSKDDLLGDILQDLHSEVCNSSFKHVTVVCSKAFSSINHTCDYTYYSKICNVLLCFFSHHFFTFLLFGHDDIFPSTFFFSFKGCNFFLLVS